MDIYNNTVGIEVYYYLNEKKFEELPEKTQKFLKANLGEEAYKYVDLSVSDEEIEECLLKLIGCHKI